MSKISVLSLALAVALTGSLSAQSFFSGTASPSIVAPGGQVALTVEASISVDLLSPCVISVHQGSPAGPVVYAPFICTTQFVTVGPGFSHNAGWPVAASTAPGDYFIKMAGFETVSQAYIEGFFPVRVDLPGSVLPVLTKTSGPVMNGSPVDLMITSPGTPSATYVVAASLTTNVGQTLSPSQHLALDFDVLFLLGYPGLNPLFTNQVGTLNGAGDATASMQIPASPLIVGWPIAFQGAVLLTVPLPGVVDSFALTTPLSYIIH